MAARRSSSFLRLAALCVLVASPLAAGCVTYSSLSFESALTPEEEATLEKVKKIEAYYAEDFDAERLRLYERGYELVGYSKFTSALQPRFAERNAKLGAKKRGAPVVMLKKPVGAKLNQFDHLITYWRPAPPGKYILGAQYDDAAPPLNAVAGCASNAVVVTAVVPKTPAETMGLVEGDTIVEANGHLINTARQLDDLLASGQGAELQLTVIRGDAMKVLVGTLGLRPPGADEIRDERRDPGLTTLETELAQPLRKELDRKKGVYVEAVRFGSLACGAELRLGDLILQADGEKIDSAKDLLKAIEKAEDGTVELVVRRAGEERRLLLDLTAEAEEISVSTFRRRIAESELAQPPWETDDGRDFTWATITAMAVQSGIASYQQYLADQAARAEAYNRAQAARAYAEPQHEITRDRNGRMYTSTFGGERVYVNDRTAALLRENPGYRVYASRRGRVQLEDQFGNRVQVPMDPVVIRATPVRLPTVSYDSVMRNAFMKASFGSAVYGNVTAMQPQTSAAIQQQPGYGSTHGGGYQVYQAQPYVGGNPRAKTSTFAVKTPASYHLKRTRYNAWDDLGGFDSDGVGGDSAGVFGLRAPQAPGAGASASAAGDVSPTVTWWPGTAAQNAFRAETSPGAVAPVPTRTIDEVVPQPR